MNEFYGVLKEIINRTETVVSFRFLPENKIKFLPGQFVRVMFDPSDKKNKNMNKYLSFSCSPGKEYIEVTKRLSDSDFSKALKRLTPGDKLMFQGPMGNCVFSEDYKKVGFLIGGIGITPVISMLEYITENKLNTDIILLYSNRNHQETAFRKELDDWKREFNNIKTVYILTDCIPEDEICIQGQINKELILSKVADIMQRKFFIFGPPVMVEAIKLVCIECGCSKDMIFEENFVGY